MNEENSVEPAIVRKTFYNIVLVKINAKLVKDQLTFIDRSGSNCSALY